MNPEATYDAQLVQRFLAGQQEAFVELMNRHRTRVYSAALSFLHSHSDAEEITQDTFIRAHRALARFRGDASVATWLHRIAVNLARNRYWHSFRRRKQDTLSLEATVGDGDTSTFSDLISTEEPDPAQETSRSEFTSAVEACLRRMDDAQRQILIMRGMLDQSYEEIAAALGINVGTVKSRIARARERLRKLLGEECPEFAAESDSSDWFEPSRGSGQVAAAAF
jgi:RNA polymerase sigma-70 factor (ECF subfamily)